MTGSEIIAKFELKVDDQSTLSSAESLGLANEVYRAVLNYKPWEWTKKEGTGVVVSGEITTPADFKYFSANYENDDGDIVVAILVGSDYEPYEVIPYSRRNDSKYRNGDGIAYYDARLNKIKFPGTKANGKSVVYDYIYKPAELEEDTSPVFPENFHDIIFFGMAADFGAIDNMPKNRTYSEEYQLKYDELLEAMSYENSKLYGGSSY